MSTKTNNSSKIIKQIIQTLNENPHLKNNNGDGLIPVIFELDLFNNLNIYVIPFKKSDKKYKLVTSAFSSIGDYSVIDYERFFILFNFALLLT